MGRGSSWDLLGLSSKEIKALLACSCETSLMLLLLHSRERATWDIPSLGGQLVPVILEDHRDAVPDQLAFLWLVGDRVWEATLAVTARRESS